MYCDCDSFRDELVNLSKEVLVKGDGKQFQWKVFEQFLLKYAGDEIPDMGESMSETPFRTLCSLKISSLLIHKLNVFRRRGIALSTLLVDLMSILHLKLCSRNHMHQLWNFESYTLNDRGTLMFLGALNRNYEFRKLLLKFGFVHRLSGDSPRLMKELECSLDYFIYMINDYHYDEEETYKTKVVINLVKKVYSYQERECYKRMFLSVIAINAIQMYILEKKYVFIENWLSCFEMYFTGTPDAFLSVFEVQCILYICFKVMNKLYLFDIYCQEFDKFMPGCPAKMEPRKLTHLTRCKIRQNLNLSNLPMPSAVDKLLLPKNLKKFLLGDIIDVSRKTGNVSSEKSVFDFELLLSNGSAFLKKQKSAVKGTKKRRLNDDD